MEQNKEDMKMLRPTATSVRAEWSVDAKVGL